MVLLCTFGIFYREYSSERERESFVEWFYFVLLESFTESILQREREREREREGLFDIIWLWYTRWVDWILKFVNGNDLYDRFEFDTFYSLSAFPKA